MGCCGSQPEAWDRLRSPEANGPCSAQHCALEAHHVAKHINIGLPLPLRELVVDYVLVSVTGYQLTIPKWPQTRLKQVSSEVDHAACAVRAPGTRSVWYHPQGSLVAVDVGELRPLVVFDAHTGEVMPPATRARPGRPKRVVFDPHRELWAVQYHDIVHLGSRTPHGYQYLTCTGCDTLHLRHGWLCMQYPHSNWLYAPGRYDRVDVKIPTLAPGWSDRLAVRIPTLSRRVGQTALYAANEGSYASLAVTECLGDRSLVRCWDVLEERAALRWEWWCRFPAQALEFGPHGHLLAHADKGSTLTLLDTRVPQRQAAVVKQWYPMRRRSDPLQSLTFSSDGCRLLLQRSSRAEVWDLRRWKRIWTDDGRLVYNAALTRLTTTSRSGQMYVWTADCLYRSQLNGVY